MVSPLQSALLKKAAEEKGSAADKRFKEKNTKYYDACHAEGIQFHPLVVETFGGWHKDSEEIITLLSMQLASHTGGKRDEVKHHLFQRLGISLARGNANLIMRRRPDQVDAIVDGDLDRD